MNGTFDAVMRGISTLIGLLMITMGVIWILQGLGIAFLGSFMANDRQWVLWGALLAILGACQTVWSVRRRR